MSKSKESEYSIPDMSRLDTEDVFSIVLGSPPEGEKIIIYEEETIESGWSLVGTHQASTCA